MKFLGMFAVLVLLSTGCGDNIVPEGPMTSKSSPSATSSVGGSQVSHSASFMLVTSVSTGDAKVQRNSQHVLQPGVGGE